MKSIYYWKKRAPSLYIPIFFNVDRIDGTVVEMQQSKDNHFALQYTLPWVQTAHNKGLCSKPSRQKNTKDPSEKYNPYKSYLRNN